MFMTPWKSLSPWVLLLEQESYLPYINLNYKLLRYKIYNTILKNHMQKSLDAITGENQAAAIKNRRILHIFSTIRDVIDVIEVKKQSCFNIFEFSLTFYIVGGDCMPFLSPFCHKFILHKFALPFLSLVMETNSFT